MATRFAYVFLGFFSIAVSEVFGAISSSSFFSLLSDLRAYVSTIGNVSAFPIDQLITQTIIEPVPPDLGTLFILATADRLNPPLSAVEQHNFGNTTYVDNDNRIAAICPNSQAALQQSIIQAHELWGYPHKTGVLYR
jgi:hypothetical protein